MWKGMSVGVDKNKLHWHHTGLICKHLKWINLTQLVLKQLFVYIVYAATSNMNNGVRKWV